MTAILLALGAALAYGASDFLGGRASTRAPFAVVTTVGQGTALVIALVAAPLVGGALTQGPTLWGLLSGLGSGIGTLFLYRGLARARVSVVAPTSGVLAAALPAGLAMLLGERPTALIIVGLLVALPAVWLISGGGQGPVADGRPSGVLDGVLAGFGFGLLFFALDRAGDGSGLWPLAIGQTASLALVSIVALLSRSAAPTSVSGAVTGALTDAVAGGGSGTAPEPVRGAWWPVAVACGALGSAATLLFFASTTSGLLTIAAVLTSLYPAGTILLARVVLDERISRRQGLGLGLAGCAVVLITLG